MTNPIRTPIFLLSLLILSGIAFSGPHDNGQGPAGVASSSYVVTPGASVSIQISLNAVTTSAQLVSLTSSNPNFVVPSTVTVPAGSSVAYTFGVASPSASIGSVTVTASANGYAATCNIGILQ